MIDPAQRAKVLFIRVSEATHQAVTEAAAAAGTGPGDWTRQVIEREVSRADRD
jgi:predicted HicB family RNase H-like nuclease